MPCKNEEMVGVGFFFLFFFFFAEYLWKQESDSMQILNLIFQCWLVLQDPGTKRWLLVKQDSSWSAGNIDESFWFFVQIMFY